MSRYDLTRRANDALLHHLHRLRAQDRQTTADIIAHIAEVDTRRLYAPAGYSSMISYCIHELRYSEDAASKRLTAARHARRFRVIFEMVADGRLHLTAITLLGSYLTETTAADLLAAAAHKTRAQIELLLAERFPRADLPTRLVSLAPAPESNVEQHAPERVEVRELQSAAILVGASLTDGCNGQTGTAQSEAAAQVGDDVGSLDATAGEPCCKGASATNSLNQPGNGAVPNRPPFARITALSPGRFGLQATIDQETLALLKSAQELLGFRVAPGDLSEVLRRALGVYVRVLQRQKFAATKKPRVSSKRGSTRPRHIPALVKRAVWARDEGQCTFVSASGRRCAERKALEFDHIEPVARGGRASVAGVRLRCRAHNQYEAERVFGAEFMRRRREGIRPSCAPAAID